MKLTDWLNALPTDLDGVNVRELALKNLHRSFFDGKYHIKDFEEALCCSFVFRYTPEGEKFWYEIASKLRGMKPIDGQIKMEL